jgi:preprotein translocase subunit SecF
MLIGIVVGTITSLFIAAPVAYNLMSKKIETEAEVVVSRRPEKKKK